MSKLMDLFQNEIHQEDIYFHKVVYIYSFVSIIIRGLFIVFTVLIYTIQVVLN
jgi:hypothetical protein